MVPRPYPPTSYFFHCYECLHIWIVPKVPRLRACPACAAVRGVLTEDRFGILKFYCLDCEHLWDEATPPGPYPPDI